MGRLLLDRAIDAVYDAAAGDTDWTQAVGSMVQLHGARRAILFTPSLDEREGGLWAMHDVPTEIQARYVHEYRDRDLWLSRGLAAGQMRSGNTVLGQQLVGEAELRGSEIYADVLRHAGLFHLCSAILSDGSDGTMPPALFALFRGENDTAFSRKDQATFNQTCRHVSRAVRMWHRMRTRGAPSEALAASLESPALMVDANLSIGWMNRAAEAWARDRRLVVREGRLQGVGGYDGAIGGFVQRALQRPVIEMTRCDSRITLEAIPAPLAGAFGVAHESRAGILLVIRDHGIGASLRRALMEQFALTPAEVDLALALASGTQLADHAEARGVSISTVRTQLKAILSKTGCHRQGQLVAAIDRLRPLLSTNG